MDQITDTPGLQHIALIWFQFLEFSDLQNCQLVKWSWNNVLQNSPLFWMKRCHQKGILTENVWKLVVQETINTDQQKYIVFYMRYKLVKQILPNLRVFSTLYCSPLNFLENQLVVPLFQGQNSAQIINILNTFFDAPLEPLKSDLTPIEVAAERGLCEIVQLLAPLSRRLNDPNRMNLIQRLICNNALACNLKTGTIIYLASMINNPNAPCPDGKTPIHLAAEQNGSEIIKCLMAFTDQPNAPNPDGWTPIQIAASRGYVEVIEVLIPIINSLEINTSNPNGHTPIKDASMNGHAKVVRLLASFIYYKLEDNPNYSRPHGLTPIQWAASNGHSEVVLELIPFVEDPNAANYCGITPIYNAARNGHLDVMKLLVPITEYPDTACLDGSTPLKVAHENGHYDVVLFLAEYLINNRDQDQITIRYYREYIQKIKKEKLLQDKKEIKIEMIKIAKAVDEVDRSLKGNEPVEKTKCIPIPRILDSGIRVEESQIINQFKEWRWPDLQSLQQLSAETFCQYPFCLDRSWGSADKTIICINPYHYERIVITSRSLDTDEYYYDYLHDNNDFEENNPDSMGPIKRRKKRLEARMQPQVPAEVAAVPAEFAAVHEQHQQQMLQIHSQLQTQRVGNHIELKRAARTPRAVVKSSHLMPERGPLPRRSVAPTFGFTFSSSTSDPVLPSSASTSSAYDEPGNVIEMESSSAGANASPGRGAAFLDASLSPPRYSFYNIDDEDLEDIPNYPSENSSTTMEIEGAFTEEFVPRAPEPSSLLAFWASGESIAQMDYGNLDEDDGDEPLVEVVIPKLSFEDDESQNGNRYKGKGKGKGKKGGK